MKTLLQLHRGLPILILFFSLSFISDNTFAQQSATTNNYQQLDQETKGIYQIQMLGVRTKPAISNDLLELVLANQLQSSRTVFSYREHIRIEVLSKDEVSSGLKFAPEELIIYLNDNQTY